MVTYKLMALKLLNEHCSLKEINRVIRIIYKWNNKNMNYESHECNNESNESDYQMLLSIKFRSWNYHTNWNSK